MLYKLKQSIVVFFHFLQYETISQTTRRFKNLLLYIFRISIVQWCINALKTHNLSALDELYNCVYMCLQLSRVVIFGCAICRQSSLSAGAVQ